MAKKAESTSQNLNGAHAEPYYPPTTSASPSPSPEQPPKKPMPKWVKIVAIVFVVLVLIGAASTCGKKDDTGSAASSTPTKSEVKKTDDSSKATKDEPEAPVVPEKTEEEKAAEARAQAKADATVSSGTYKVGSEIPAGQYYLVGSGYFAILKDSSGTLDAIIANDNFSGNSIVDLADGQYFELKGASMYPIEFYDPIEKTEFKDGMYRVGIDMPAGEYKVTSFGIRVHRSHLRREPYARRHHHERPRRGQHVPDRERRAVRQALGSHGHAGVSRPCSTRADGSCMRLQEPSALSCDRVTAGIPPARAGGIRRA